MVQSCFMFLFVPSILLLTIFYMLLPWLPLSRNQCCWNPGLTLDDVQERKCHLVDEMDASCSDLMPQLVYFDPIFHLVMSHMKVNLVLCETVYVHYDSQPTEQIPCLISNWILGDLMIVWALDDKISDLIHGDLVDCLFLVVELSWWMEVLDSYRYGSGKVATYFWWVLGDWQDEME